MSDEIEILGDGDLIHFRIEARMGDLVKVGNIIESIYLLRQGSKRLVIEKAIKMLETMLEEIENE